MLGRLRPSHLGPMWGPTGIFGGVHRRQAHADNDDNLQGIVPIPEPLFIASRSFIKHPHANDGKAPLLLSPPDHDAVMIKQHAALVAAMVAPAVTTLMPCI